MSTNTTGMPDMKADCSRCAGLCCAAFAFERSDMFAIDKAVDEACPNLDAAYGCKIHASRIEDGFKGCTLFDCHGAGQRLTQEVFGGRSWRDDPAIAPEMFESFRKLLKVHDYLRLLSVLENLPLSESERGQVDAFREILAPAEGWSRHSLAHFEEMPVITRFEIFAASLKDSAAGKALRARFSA